MNTKTYFKQAKEKKWAIPQFNFSSLEQLKGIIASAQKLKTPVILGTSEGEVGYIGIQEAVSLVNIMRWKNKVKAILHLDHAKNWGLIKSAIDAGYDSIHFDGSFLGFEANIAQTKKVVKYARSRGVFVEGEIDAILGESKLSSNKIVIQKDNFSLPENVKKFASLTNVDSLAISIGSFHGMWAQEKNLDFELLSEISKTVKNVFLVLHGGSDISQDQIKKAIDFGISKVNFNTELRITWKKSLISSLKDEKEFKPYNILPKTVEAVMKKAEEKISLLGSNNRL